MEKAIAPHAIDKQLGFLHPLRGVETAHVIAGIGTVVAGSEGGEIVLTEYPGGGALHSVHIQRRIVGIDVACLPGRANLSAKDFVFVGFCLRTVPGVEVAPDPGRAEYPDRSRENTVERTGQIRLGNRCCQRKRCDLA